MGPASVRTEGGEAARGNDFVLVDGDGRAEMATAWVSSCGVLGMRALGGGVLKRASAAHAKAMILDGSALVRHSPSPIVPV